MLRTFIIQTLILSITACAYAPSKETARIESPFNYIQTIEIITHMVHKCWTKPVGIHDDAIYGLQDTSSKVFKIVLGRDNTDIKFVPFANILVLGKETGKTYVSVMEGDVFLAEKWGVDISVQSWLTGKTVCTNT